MQDTSSQKTSIPSQNTHGDVPRATRLTAGAAYIQPFQPSSLTRASRSQSSEGGSGAPLKEHFLSHAHLCSDLTREREPLEKVEMEILNPSGTSSLVFEHTLTRNDHHLFWAEVSLVAIPGAESLLQNRCGQMPEVGTNAKQMGPF